MKHILCCFLFVLSGNVFSQLNLNQRCQEILSDPETGLVATSIDNYDYTYAERNTTAITNALKRLSKTEDLLLPEGTYDVNTILVPQTVAGCIAGSGLDKTVLRKTGFSWDNNTQGDCTSRTEVFLATNMKSLKLSDMTIDGNSHHIGISGYGTWNATNGSVTSGLPQFPTYKSEDSFPASTGSVIYINLSKNIAFENVAFKNGFRWCIFLGKIDGFIMRSCIIDTGNLSTEFKGHLDPGGTVLHMHTSQDGLHMVNVSNVLIEYNDIHSEDSAIAVELNPAWDWGGYNEVENVVIKNNYISTASPTDPDKLLTDPDKYGNRLATKWIGQSAVDIFYNENYDIQGDIPHGGADGRFRNIEIKENAFSGVRQGVRCGFFIGAGANHAQHHRHRVYNLVIKDHEPTFMAGRNMDKPAGIKNVSKNTHSTSWNLSGGAGVAVRHTDSLIVANNIIEDVKGGLGISIENVTRFVVSNNRVNNVSGKQLGALGVSWVGGEGIRIYNNPNLQNDPNWENGCFNAGYFLVTDNYVGNVETTKLAVINTRNGTVKLNKNYDFNGNRLCNVENALTKTNVQLIDWGNCDESSLPGTNELKYTVYPNPVEKELILDARESLNAELFNMHGDKVFAGKIFAGTNLIPVAHLPASIYLLVIHEKNQLSNQYKIIKK